MKQKLEAKTSIIECERTEIKNRNLRNVWSSKKHTMIGMVKKADQSKEVYTKFCTNVNNKELLTNYFVRFYK